MIVRPKSPELQKLFPFDRRTGLGGKSPSIILSNRVQPDHGVSFRVCGLLIKGELGIAVEVMTLPATQSHLTRTKFGIDKPVDDAILWHSNIIVEKGTVKLLARRTP